MRLYHRTTPEAAREIAETRRFVSKEGNEVCFSNRRNGYASGYGTSVVVVDMPRGTYMLDDEFQTGEKHYRVLIGDLTSERIVSVDIAKEGGS